MEKKESYKHILPHFQKPGQSYFVTWNLHEAIPKKVFIRYTSELEILKSQINFLEKQKPDSFEIEKAKQEYYSLRKQYIKAYDELLDADRNPKIDLSKTDNLEIMYGTLQFWEGQRLQNIAYTIMPNHIHWVVKIYEKDNKGNPVYLQDILQSVKRFSSNKINKAEKRSGTLWQKESFETTIRNEKHEHYAIKYTLNNPVRAGLVSDWRDWKGTWCKSSDF
jgi:putative transposase